MKLESIAKEYAIYGTLFSLSNRIQTIGDKEFKNITLKQQFLLVGLQMFEEPPTLKEMGTLIGCSYQNVKRMAKQLEEKDYLKIVKDETDKRKLLLVMTDLIAKEDKRNSDKTEKFINRLYQDIPKKDLIVTLRTLTKMDQNIRGIAE